LDRRLVLNFLRKPISRTIEPLALWLVRIGVTANAVTVFGTVGAVAASFYFFTNGWWFWGAFVIWGCVMLDMVDGAVARASAKPSKFGAVLDSTCDRIADASIFGCIGWYYARHNDGAMLALCLFCLVLGSLTSYVRARAEGAGLTASVGIAERSERLIIVLVGTGLSGENIRIPYVQAGALWILVVAGTITVAQRLATVYTQSRALDRAVPDSDLPASS
jgi:CDP-diacylglycerol--glycerol-3-phosphate 3-phosphatidyltransferase